MKKLFISYSRKEKEVKETVARYLRLIGRTFSIEVMDDSMLTPGENYRTELTQIIKECEYAIILMSSHFLTSEFVGNFELPLIEKRAGQGRLKLFILILDHIPKTPLLKSIQYVNSSAKPYHHISEAEQELILTELHDAICDQLRRDQTGIEHHIDVLTFKSSVVAMAILRVLDSSEKSYSITELTKMIQSASSTVSRKGVSDAIKALEKAALIERRDMKQNKSTNAQVHFASSKNSQKFLNILNPSDQ